VGPGSAAQLVAPCAPNVTAFWAPLERALAIAVIRAPE